MLQETSWLIFLSTIMMTAMPGSAFNSDRAENVAVTGSVNSALDVESKVTMDNASSAKAEITSIDRAQQIAGTKSTSAVEQLSPANLTRREKLGFKLVTEDPNPTKENKAINGVSSTPLNIVMAITKPSQVRDDTLQSIKDSHQFVAEGTLQSCNCSQVEGTRYPLDDPLNTGNKMRRQDCEHFLRSNIANLLMWARDVKGMTTELIGLSKDFDEIDEYNTKPTVQKLKPEIRGDWRTIDLGKPVNNEFLPFSDSQEEDEAAWKVFDMFSKVKWALFRSLLESLSGNIAATEESTPSRKLRALRSNLVDVVEELKSVENENGFILVASVPAIELDSALELLQREATQDTLLVVTRVCSHDTKTVPFFAQGPSANMLREATTIWDVPDVIRNIIAGGCQDSNCRSRRHDIFPPSIPSVKRNHHNVVTLKRSARDIAKKSDDMQGGDVSAVKDEDKNGEDLNSKNEEAKDAKAKGETSGNKDAKAKEETSGNKDAKAKEETSGNEDAKAKEETSGNKDAKAKEETSGNKDANAKAEINGDHDAKAKEGRDGGQDVMAKTERGGDKGVMAKTERGGAKGVMANTERDGKKYVITNTERDGGKGVTAKADRNADKNLNAIAGKNGSGSFKVAEKFTSIISTVISMAVVFTLAL